MSKVGIMFEGYGQQDVTFETVRMEFVHYPIGLYKIKFQP